MTEKGYDSLADRLMRELGDWRRDNLPSRSRRTSLVEAITGTYWVFRSGPCHCWAFGKGFIWGRKKIWSKEHPVLSRYFAVVEVVCKLIHARRDYYWKLELDLLVFGYEITWPREAWRNGKWWETVIEILRYRLSRRG